MDVGNKLIEIANRHYLMLVKELNAIGVSPTIGMLVAQSICAKFENDALAICSSENVVLENELSNKMKEIEELKQNCSDKKQDENSK